VLGKQCLCKACVSLALVDWNFKMDGVLHNASQDDTFDVGGREAVTGAMEGYNGEITSKTMGYVVTKVTW